MWVTDLDGNETKWKITKGTSKDTRKKSGYHERARAVIIRAYPTVQLSEEIAIAVRKSSKLYLDFYIPLLGIAVEIQGEQHFKFIPHFHGSPLKFLAAKQRDADKEAWCALNGITLVKLPYNEDDDEWYKRIKVG